MKVVALVRRLQERQRASLGTRLGTGWGRGRQLGSRVSREEPRGEVEHVISKRPLRPGAAPLPCRDILGRGFSTPLLTSFPRKKKKKKSLKNNSSPFIPSPIEPDGNLEEGGDPSGAAPWIGAARRGVRAAQCLTERARAVCGSCRGRCGRPESKLRLKSHRKLFALAAWYVAVISLMGIEL